MILPLAYLLTTGILLIQHDVQAITIGRPNPLTGQPTTNFRNADFDGDGAQDLLLPNQVSLQRGGEFPPTLSLPLPLLEQNPKIDHFGPTLYLRTPGKLQRYQLQGLTWKIQHEQTLQWPDLTPPTDTKSDQPTNPPQHPTLARYLHDLTGDGIPEIIVLGPDGLHLYSQEQNTYRQTHILDILPPRKVRLPQAQTLWPDHARKITYPPTHSNFQLLIHNREITVITNNPTHQGLLRHTITRWTTDPQNPLAPIQQTPTHQQTPPLPPFLKPCFLNPSKTIGFAGTHWDFTQNSLLPERIQQTILTTDHGATLQTFRSKSFQSLTALTDFDGDGDLDALIETTGLYQGGLREFLTRSMTERALHHSLKIHLQDSQGHFSKTPHLKFQTSIGLAQPPFRNGFLFREYQNGASFNLTGDLNGDGLKDLVTRNRADRLNIYLNQNLTYPKSPDRTITIDPTHTFAIADIDADGNSDIIIQPPQSPNPNKPTPPAKVHFSRDTPQ